MKGYIKGIESVVLNLKIKELALQGMGSREIGDELGYAERLIRGRLTRMRRAKAIPPVLQCREDRGMRTTIRNLCQKYDKNLGRLTYVMSQLTDEETLWMYNETPKGMMVADLVVALIRDAYAEDTGNG
jgi:hypothetical protein